MNAGGDVGKVLARRVGASRANDDTPRQPLFVRVELSSEMQESDPEHTRTDAMLATLQQEGELKCPEPNRIAGEKMPRQSA
jgi:hypothetical protein